MICPNHAIYPDFYELKQFSSPGFIIDLLPDNSAYVHFICTKCTDSHHLQCFEYDNVFDFLEPLKPQLDKLPREHAVFRLAEHLNYPLCIFIDMIKKGAEKRRLEATQAASNLQTIKHFNSAGKLD